MFQTSGTLSLYSYRPRWKRPKYKHRLPWTSPLIYGDGQGWIHKKSLKISNNVPCLLFLKCFWKLIFDNVGSTYSRVKYICCTFCRVLNVWRWAPIPCSVRYFLLDIPPNIAPGPFPANNFRLHLRHYPGCWSENLKTGTNKYSWHKPTHDVRTWP